jgi:hypothetical protein
MIFLSRGILDRGVKSVTKDALETINTLLITLGKFCCHRVRVNE